jgi:cyclic 2,3-diphosphoglycerate synthetase
VLISDLVLTMDERVAHVAAALGDAPVLRFDMRMKPSQPLEGRRTAVFTTGGTAVDHLDAEVVHVSANLARRDLLRDELARVDAEVFLVEVKAAAIDVVAEAAFERGKRVVFAENEIVCDGLDEHIGALVPEVAVR